jgi:hypothetical protein
VRRRLGAAGVLATSLLLACGDERARSPAAGAPPDLRTRIATIPSPPASEDPPTDPAVPIAGVCLSGEPDRGEMWRVGGLDSVDTFRMTSIEALAPRDSARLVARLARTVDALPSDTGTVDFRGLPVVVVAAWQIVLALGDTVVVANAARRLPIESAPLEERFTLVAIPVVVPTIREPLQVAWHSREVGAEDALVPREPVVAWSSEQGPAILLAASGEARPRVEVLVRVGGAWRSAWTGGIDACASP